MLGSVRQVLVVEVERSVWRMGEGQVGKSRTREFGWWQVRKQKWKIGCLELEIDNSKQIDIFGYESFAVRKVKSDNWELKIRGWALLFEWWKLKIESRKLIGHWIFESEKVAVEKWKLVIGRSCGRNWRSKIDSILNLSWNLKGQL